MKNGEWPLCFNKNPTSPLALPGLREAETRGEVRENHLPPVLITEDRCSDCSVAGVFALLILILTGMSPSLNQLGGGH